MATTWVGYGLGSDKGPTWSGCAWGGEGVCFGFASIRIGIGIGIGIGDWVLGIGYWALGIVGSFGGQRTK